MVKWSSPNRTRLMRAMEKTIFVLPFSTMKRRPFPQRHLLRTNDSELAPSPGHPSEATNSMPCRLQDPSWEDLLGQR
ncbi:MAG: hypothetical protein RLZZ609_569 [Cyanobacteriota bacterium]|jgi:hypothetical protein